MLRYFSLAVCCTERSRFGRQCCQCDCEFQHTHTHTRTHARAHIHIYKYIHTCMHWRLHVYTHEKTRACARTHIYARTHARAHTHMYACTHARTHVHTLRGTRERGGATWCNRNDTCGHFVTRGWIWRCTSFINCRSEYLREQLLFLRANSMSGLRHYIWSVRRWKVGLSHSPWEVEECSVATRNAAKAPVCTVKRVIMMPLMLMMMMIIIEDTNVSICESCSEVFFSHNCCPWTGAKKQTITKHTKKLWFHSFERTSIWDNCSTRFTMKIGASSFLLNAITLLPMSSQKQKQASGEMYSVH